MEGNRDEGRRARARESDKLVRLDLDNPEERRKSLYYWWWIYLRENKDYEETCSKNGKGEHEKLYRDFGNVHTTSFAAWWKDKVWMLFGEPWQGIMAKRFMDQVQKIRDRGDSLDGEIWVDLKIPLHVSSHRVAALLEGLTEREQRRFKINTAKGNSEPKYELVGKAIPDTLDIDLKIRKKKLASEDEDWKIGVEFGLNPSNNKDGKLTPGQPPDFMQKNRLRHTVYDRHTRANVRVYGAARGEFPGKRPFRSRDDPDST